MIVKSTNNQEKSSICIAKMEFLILIYYSLFASYLYAMQDKN